MTGGYPIIVFETTHHALWAEEIAREQALGAESVPAPREAEAGCDLALEVLPEDLAALTDALRERGITFRVIAARG